MVNIPNDLDVVQDCLPRNAEEATVIEVGLKRKMAHKGTFLRQDITPVRVYEALEALKDTPLYAEVEVRDRDTWERANADALIGRDMSCRTCETYIMLVSRGLC
jgi:hypothetical protein